MSLNVQEEFMESVDGTIRIKSENDGEVIDFTVEMDPLLIPDGITSPEELAKYLNTASMSTLNVQEFTSLIDRFGVSHLLFVWAWDDEDKVYRDDETGKEMNEEEFIALRDQIVDWQVDYFSKWPVTEEEKPKKKEDPNVLALLLLGIITLGVWEAKMRDALQDSSVIQYVVGRGGFDQMTDNDWMWLESWLLTQYGFLNGFSLDIADGLLSEAQIAARSYLYFSSAVSAFEYGRMKGQHENLNLSRHPGDCTSQCCARDRCFWRYIRRKDRIVINWVRTAKESCLTCIERSICPPVVFMKDSGEHINMECYERADAA